MALSAGVFHPDFVAHHKPVVKSSFWGRVLIEREGERAQWNPDTGEYEGGGMILLFKGNARVQKVARPTRRENVQDMADSQVVRVQVMEEDNEIPFPEDFQWHDNDRVLVVASDEAPELDNTVLYLHGWVGSTNAWTTTLTCRHNTKQGKFNVGD